MKTDEIVMKINDIQGESWEKVMLQPDFGLIALRNERVPQLEVRPQDRIVAVNDQNTAEAMAKDLQSIDFMLQTRVLMRISMLFISFYCCFLGGSLRSSTES